MGIGHTAWTLSNIVLYSLLLTILITVIMCACLLPFLYHYYYVTIIITDYMIVCLNAGTYKL